MSREISDRQPERSDGSREPAAGPTTLEFVEAHKLKILHLEDSDTDAELVGRQLRKAGLAFTIERATGRDSFLRTLERFRPDVILMDFALPDFDGLTALRLLRERDADLPVIVVTGVLGDEAAVGLIQAGANDYVLKDRLARLATAVKNAVAEAEQARARRRAEESLRLSEERCRSLIAATAQMMWNTGPLGEAGEDLTGWRAYTGQSVEQARGQGWLEALDAAGREQVVAAWRRCVQTGAPYEGEWRIRRRDGQYGYFHTRAVPLRDANGAIREWIGCNIDITERKHYEQRLERHNRQMKVIKNLSDMLQACNSRQEAYPFIGLALEELRPGSSGALAVPPAEPPELLETVAEWGEARWISADFSFEDCWALRRGGLHEPGEGTECHHFCSGPPGPHLCLPLLVRGEIAGLLTMALPGAEIDEEVRSEIAALGDTLALCLANLKLRETLQKQTMQDSLTGLLSFQYVEESLPREIRRCEQQHDGLAVAALAIDHFREIRDEHGRAAADHVLSEIGALVRGGLGPYDLACRRNTEEFVLLLIAGERDALERLQRICREVAEKSLSYRGRVLAPITVSAGLARWAQPGTTAGELMDAAYQALDAARRGGAGRVEALTVAGMQPAG